MTKRPQVIPKAEKQREYLSERANESHSERTQKWTTRRTKTKPGSKIDAAKMPKEAKRKQDAEAENDVPMSEATVVRGYRLDGKVPECAEG